MLNALQICTEALDGIGVDPPTSLTTGGDLGNRLRGIANAVGQNLAMRYEWDVLRKEGTFNTTAGVEEQVDFSTAFPDARKIFDDIFFNRTTQRRLFPLTAQGWARVKSDGFSPTTEVYYIRNKKLLMPLGSTTTGQTIAFEYLDTRWAETSGESPLRRFEGDTNLPLLDDHLFVLGVRWRYLQSLGLEYGEHFREFEDYVAQKIAEDRPRETISLNPYQRSEGYDTQIPDGNWNL